jgi:hypothetical protein
MDIFLIKNPVPINNGAGFIDVELLWVMLYAQQLSPSSFTPSFLRIFSIKHHFVKDDCNKLTPTKPVNHNQLIFTYTANKRLIKIKVPAIALIYLLIIIINFSYVLVYMFMVLNSSTPRLFNSSTSQPLDSSTPQLLNPSTPQLLNP